MAEPRPVIQAPATAAIRLNLRTLELEPRFSAGTTAPRLDRSRLPSFVRPRSAKTDSKETATPIDDQSLYSQEESDTGVYYDGPSDTETLRGEEPQDNGMITYGWDWVNMREFEEFPPHPVPQATKEDLEFGSVILEKVRTMKDMTDPNIVTWDGPDDPENPKNWSKNQKWAATIVVSSFTFISPISSTIIAPAISAIARDFNIVNAVHQELVLSIFVLAYGVGPLFLGPLSEIYGRALVLQLANLFYLAFNVACGFSQSKWQIIAFRLLSGLGGSAPLAIGGAVVSDIWRAEERGQAIALYSLAPLLGPALGPIVGGFIAQYTTWRWAFAATSIADIFIQISGLWFLRETYAPKILHTKAKKLRKSTGNPKLKTEFEYPERSLANTIKRSLVRPFKLLATQPIVQVLAIYMAYIYGLIYLVISTFPELWELRYDESIGIGGLNFISLGLGFFLGSQTAARVNDRLYRSLKRKNMDVGKPEFRVPLMFPGSCLVPIGLFIYGWSAQAHTHWIVPNIGACIFGLGCIICLQCTQTYLVDSYTMFAASAVAGVTVLRSAAGFGFPLFAPFLYNALDYGWGNSVLAFIAIFLGLPAPLMLWRYGQTLREKSTYAAG